MSKYKTRAINLVSYMEIHLEVTASKREDAIDALKTYIQRTTRSEPSEWSLSATKVEKQSNN